MIYHLFSPESVTPFCFGATEWCFDGIGAVAFLLTASDLQPS